MLLTQAQLQEIRQIIADHHSAFVANVVSPEAVAPEILERLKQKGLYAPKIESIREAYLYGQLLASLDDPKVASMDYEEFKRYIRVHPVPLTTIERQAVMMAQQQAGQYAVGLGNRVDQQTGQVLIEADHVLRQQLRDEIKTATAENVERRETVKQLKSDLGWATRDWSRDWQRIAVTEKQNAMQHGVADSYAAQYGTDVLVAKRAMPDACEHCKRLHNGPDGAPRIYKLSTLLAHGTNFHTKAADWQAVVGPVHPHCQCQLIRIPPGFGFDEDGRLVPGGTLGVHYESVDELEASMKAEQELCKSVRLPGTIDYQGLQVRIENPAGSTRHWTDAQGKQGSTKMRYPYGFIAQTEGQDGDEVDVFVGPDPRSPFAFIVHQQDPKTKQYDETKCFVGFRDLPTVEKVYRQHYDRPDFALWTDTLSLEGFKRWLGGLQKSKPPRAERFVLSKGDAQPIGSNASSPIAASAITTVSERALSAWRGAGVNYAVGSPPRGQPKTNPAELTPDVTTILRMDEDREVPDSLRRDLDVYTFNETLERIVRPFDLPADWYEQFQKLRDEAPKNKADTNREHNRIKPVVRNTVDPRDSQPLEKSTVPRRKIERTPVRALPGQGVSR